MSKTMLMLELGWTSKQYHEENTMEDLAQLMMVLDKRASVQHYPKPPAAKSSPPIHKGPTRRYR
jgi:hypothetical protein